MPNIEKQHERPSRPSMSLLARRRPPLARCCGRALCSAAAAADRPARVRVAEAAARRDGLVEIRGWVSAVRKLSRKLTFLHVHDGVCSRPLQVVARKLPVNHIGTGSAVTVRGTLVPSRGAEQPVELAAQSIRLLGAVSDNLPHSDAAKTRHRPGDWRPTLHARPKARGFAALLRVRNAVKVALVGRLQELDYVWVETPVVTRNDCEGAGETFQLAVGDDGKQFFGRPVHLSVSGQLHLEALAGGVARVFALGPTLRADKNLTKQHLAEFLMLEVETAFCDDLDDAIDLTEDLVQCGAAAAARVYRDNAAQLDRFYGSELAPSFAQFEQPFVRLRYDEALDTLAHCAEEFAFPFDTPAGLMKEHERALVAAHSGRPVFVTHFPGAHKPFYMRRDGDTDTALAFDLLAGTSGELAGGSVRECDADVLRRRIGEQQRADALQWYVDLRRWGYAPSAGFGIGLDRMIQSVLGINNLKDCVPFPRWHGSCLM